MTVKFNRQTPTRLSSSEIKLIVLAYFQHLEERSLALPADAKAPTIVSMGLVAREMGVHWSVTRRYSCRVLVRSRVRRLGLKVR